MTWPYATFFADADENSFALFVRLVPAKSRFFVTSVVRLPNRSDDIIALDIASRTLMKFGPVLPVEARAIV
ncbi:MAG: hypothetical protein MUE82_07810 [Chloroflexi bacterium]|nr:hypothetical protein [Chloroflexota bacterium]